MRANWKCNCGIMEKKESRNEKKVAEDKGRDKNEKQDGLGEEQRDNR